MLPISKYVSVYILIVTWVAACCVVVLIVLLTFFTAPTVLFKNAEFSKRRAPIFLFPLVTELDEPCFVQGHKSISWFTVPMFKNVIDLILEIVWWKYMLPTGTLSFIIMRRCSKILECSTLPIIPSVMPKHSISSMSERSHAETVSNGML